MQEQTWAPPGGTLGRLTAEARVRAAHLPAESSLLDAALRSPVRPSFCSALLGDAVAVIAELKRRSPSKGEINGALDAAETAAAYVRGGAAALSILTEPESFGGSVEDLRAVAAAVGIPLLRKDFHVDPRQIFEARSCGASAVLLIARALTPDELPLLVSAAREVGLDYLVEIRDEWELDRALEVDAQAIGVNSRDLETLRIDPATTERLIPLIPAGRIAIAESGITGPAHVAAAAAWGADAVLVGSSVSASSDPASAVRELTGVARSGRHG